MFIPHNVSRVICHVSPVTCHLSPVTCQKNIFIYKKKISPSQKLDKVVELVGGGSVINGAYPVQFLTRLNCSQDQTPYVTLQSWPTVMFHISIFIIFSLPQPGRVHCAVVDPVLGGNCRLCSASLSPTHFERWEEKFHSIFNRFFAQTPAILLCLLYSLFPFPGTVQWTVAMVPGLKSQLSTLLDLS